MSLTDAGSNDKKQNVDFEYSYDDESTIISVAVSFLLVYSSILFVIFKHFLYSHNKKNTTINNNNANNQTSNAPPQDKSRAIGIIEYIPLHNYLYILYFTFGWIALVFLILLILDSKSIVFEIVTGLGVNGVMFAIISISCRDYQCLFCRKCCYKQVKISNEPALTSTINELSLEEIMTNKHKYTLINAKNNSSGNKNFLNKLLKWCSRKNDDNVIPNNKDEDNYKNNYKTVIEWNDCGTCCNCCIEYTSVVYFIIGIIYGILFAISVHIDTDNDNGAWLTVILVLLSIVIVILFVLVCFLSKLLVVTFLPSLVVLVLVWLKTLEPGSSNSGSLGIIWAVLTFIGLSLIFVFEFSVNKQMQYSAMMVKTAIMGVLDVCTDINVITVWFNKKYYIWAAIQLIIMLFSQIFCTIYVGDADKFVKNLSDGNSSNGDNKRTFLEKILIFTGLGRLYFGFQSWGVVGEIEYYRILQLYEIMYEEIPSIVIQFFVSLQLNGTQQNLDTSIIISLIVSYLAASFSIVSMLRRSKIYEREKGNKQEVKRQGTLIFLCFFSIVCFFCSFFYIYIFELR